MNKSEKDKLIKDTATGAISSAVTGSAVAVAGGFLTGATLTTVTTTSWFIFTTTATVVAPWAVAGCIAAGAVAGAVGGGVASYLKSKRDIEGTGEFFEDDDKDDK